MAKTSFLPEDYVEKRKQRRTNVLSLTLFAVVMAAIIGAFLATDRQRVEVRKLQRQVDEQFAEAARQLEQLDELQVQKRQMFRKAQVSAVLLERYPRSLILSELINNMPANLSLVELNLDTKTLRGPAPTTAMQRAQGKLKGGGAGPMAEEVPDVKPTEVTMSLVGLAPTDVEVSQYMTALARSSLIADINLAFSREDMIEEVPMRRFRVDLVLDQSVDITQVEPKRVERDLKQNPMAETVRLAPASHSVTNRNRAPQGN